MIAALIRAYHNPDRRGIKAMGAFNSNTGDGLYKRPDSPYWWMSFVVKGQRIRLSTKCSRFEAAQQAYRKTLAELNGQEVKDEWALFVEQSAKQPRSWLRRLLNGAKSRGQKNGKGCTLTFEQLVIIALRSNGACEVTGIKFASTGIEGDKKLPLSPSLDRIDSSQGYIFENCRLVCTAVNFAMNNWGEEVMLLIAKAMLFKHLQEALEHPEMGQ